MKFNSGKQTIQLENLETVKENGEIDIRKLQVKPLPLDKKLRTNRLVISKDGSSYGKEVPVRIFLMGGRDSKITQFSSFYEDETCYLYMQGRVILAQIIMFEKKPVSTEYSPILNINYSRGQELKKLENHQKIWRYMNFFKFEDLINSKKLFFNRLDRFEDKLEGISPFSCEESILNSQPNKSHEEKLENIRLMNERFLFAKNSTFTSCWHINDNLNERMWNEYANERGSVAVETTYGDLMDAKETIQFPVHIERIRYFEEPFVNQESYWFPFLFKRKDPFEWENELRLSIYSYNYDNLTSIKAKVPIHKFVKKIHLSPQAKKYELIQIQKLLKKNNLNIPIFFKNQKVTK